MKAAYLVFSGVPATLEIFSFFNFLCKFQVQKLCFGTTFKMYMYMYVQCRVFYRYLKLCFTIDSYYNRCTCTSLYNVLLMCFQDADLSSKKKLLLSGTCLTGHFYGQFSIIVSTTHSYILLFSDISFLNYLFWKELMLKAKPLVSHSADK